jgi:hypothetical protein
VTLGWTVNSRRDCSLVHEGRCRAIRPWTARPGDHGAIVLRVLARR